MPEFKITLLIAFGYSTGYFLVALWRSHQRWHEEDRALTWRQSVRRYLHRPGIWRQNLRCTAISVIALFGIAIVNPESGDEDAD